LDAQKEMDRKKCRIKNAIFYFKNKTIKNKLIFKKFSGKIYYIHASSYH
jgi:hypothetical protein